MARIGAIDYLNAVPLVAPLADHRNAHVVHYDLPSRLAKALRTDELDVALVPQVEACARQDYRIVRGPCIACHGAVDSILLFARKPLADVQRIVVDHSSNSSVALLKVLYHRQYGRIPECVVGPPDLQPLATKEQPADAVLLIGDRALEEARKHDTSNANLQVTDLGQWWWDQTELPFVFALWVGQEQLAHDVVKLLLDVAETGVATRAQLAREFCDTHPGVLPLAAAVRYVTDVIHYELDDACFAAVNTFYRYRQEAQLAPQAQWQPRFYGEVGR